MEIIDDIKSNRQRIENSIKKYGYAPEHNADWFEFVKTSKQKPIFVVWPDGTALFTHKEEKKWYIFSEPIAPEAIGAERVIEFTDYALRNFKIKKVVLELSTPIRKDLLNRLPSHLRVTSINYTLEWPVQNMEKFDPALPGGHFKSIRNAKNKFYKENNVEIIDARDVNKGLLHLLVDAWANKRIGYDKAYTYSYHNLIDNGFKGTESHRAMVANEKPVGFNAGWKIPNSERFYSSVGTHDYSLSDLGLMLYLEDLGWIKNAGYKEADMGGVEKGNPLNFKLQFLPDFLYKTFVFSIVKK